jgi:hypothetical protein
MPNFIKQPINSHQELVRAIEALKGDGWSGGRRSI